MVLTRRLTPERRWPCVGARPGSEEQEADLRAAIADCDRRIGTYRALLDCEDAHRRCGWIAVVQLDRKGLERQLGRHVPGDALTADDVKALVGALADADAADKAELYDQLGISLHYDPAGSVSVQLHARGVQVGVGGAMRTLTPRSLGRGRYAVAAG